MNVTRQLMSTLKKFKTDIQSSLSAIHGDLERQTRELAEANSAANLKQRVPAEVIAKVDFPKCIKTKQNAPENRGNL